MLVLVAIHTKIFPVTAVCRIIIMIPVAMMDGKQMKIRLIELAAALGAYPPMKL
jgi:hypothetical protein